MWHSKDSFLIDRLIRGGLPSEVLTRRAMYLFESGWNCREISEELGLSVNAIQQRISRARRLSASSVQL